MKYGYQAEKFGTARRLLMLPVPGSEDTVIASAFHECSLAFNNLDESGLDDNSRMWIYKIRNILNTDGLKDRLKKGLWYVKAEGMSSEEKREFAHLVDDLTDWFDRHNSFK